MSTILEELKARLAAAQARAATAQLRLQNAQAEANAANLSVNVWSNAVNIEAGEEAARAAEAAKDQRPLDLGQGDSAESIRQGERHAVVEEEPINKTEFVRDLVRQSAGGMAPAAIWDAFHEIAPNASRNYLYSILKRLRDKDEFTQRRGKYFAKVKPVSAAVPTDTPEQGEEGLFVN